MAELINMNPTISHDKNSCMYENYHREENVNKQQDHH